LVELVAAQLGAQPQLVVHQAVVDFFAPSAAPPSELLSSETLPTLTGEQELATMIRRASEHRRTHPDDAPEYAVSAVVGGGRRVLAGHLAVALGLRGLWVLELPKALALDSGDEELRRASAMAALGGLAVLVEGLEDCESARRWMYRTRAILCANGAVLIWKLSLSPPDWLTLPPEQLLRLSLPPREQRLQVWQRVTQGLLSPERQSELAGRFLLSVGQIQEAGRWGRNELARSGCVEVQSKRCRVRGQLTAERERFERFCQAARAVAGSGLGALAQAETSNVVLDSLVLDAPTRSLLDELLSYCRYRHSLAHEMGFAESLPYGLGVTALFTGPPGTGKSHAANAIARELQRELYRVDLSQLVSKYIGETEKHLSQLFDVAQGNDVMLLFDEADALFAKRTEVKSSTDRYANLEVGYLLQRMERFDGLVILTTNHESSIDEAFQRRIRFRVAFDLPDAEARLELWRGTLPRAVRLASDVDLELLARAYELSGGHIKEAVLRAAGLALGEVGGVAAHAIVSQRHLLRSVDAEYRKLGKLPPLQHNGAYQTE
jgi:Cdc6-like AAA superfamily ATPase